MNMELIVWLDHHEPVSENVWWTPDDHATVTGPAVIESVGWVIREEPDWLMIVSQISEDGWTNKPLVLVKSCIIERASLGGQKKEVARDGD